MTLARQEPSTDVTAWRALEKKGCPCPILSTLLLVPIIRASFPFSFNQWLMLNHKKHTWWWWLKDQGKIRDWAWVVSPAKCPLLIEEAALPSPTDFLDNGINKERVQKDCLNHPENLIRICWRVILLSFACLFCLGFVLFYGGVGGDGVVVF